MRGFLWRKALRMGISPSAAYTEVAPPIPAPPENELNNPVTIQTIRSYPHLFQIVTSINVDQLESYLQNHPNHPLVESIVSGFRDRFWPFTETEGRDIPVIVDMPNQPFSDEQMEFVRMQRDEEVALGRYSSAFGPDLLPGMQTSPLGVVPKPHSNKLHLVVDQSAGEYALNPYIAKSDATIRLDNLKDFGQCLVQFYKKNGRGPRYLFKSDVSQAYRRLLEHPDWQIKQVVTINRDRHVDRCNVSADAPQGRFGASSLE
ncbi:hypothetical protein FRC05_005827 [Tulasnella sp. 425]|nr:hypothetical protein FRC05_005827 [Tulasnella sp. 425]